MSRTRIPLPHSSWPRFSVPRLPIGPSAIEQGYAVATLNARHFRKIPDLQVISSL
jgi:predicted nucleic acid-binding protein